MKTLASLLLMSATFLGASAYAQEPPGLREYRPVLDQITSLTRVQVVREIQAVKAGGLVGFNEMGQPIADVASDEIVLEVIRVEAATVDVIGTYPSRGESYNTAFSTAGDPTLGEFEEAAIQLAADEVADERIVADASDVEVIGIYPPGDQSYKAAFSVNATSRG